MSAPSERMARMTVELSVGTARVWVGLRFVVLVVGGSAIVVPPHRRFVWDAGTARAFAVALAEAAPHITDGG